MTRAAGLARLSVVRTLLATPEERATQAREALTLAAASGDQTVEAAALAALNDAIAGPDHVADRLRGADRIIAIADHESDTALALLGLRLRLVARLESGDLTGVDHDIAEYDVRAQRLRLPIYSWPVPLWRGMRAAMEGDYDTALSRADEVDRLGREAGSANATMMAWTLRLQHAKATQLADRVRGAASGYRELERGAFAMGLLLRLDLRPLRRLRQGATPHGPDRDGRSRQDPEGLRVGRADVAARRGCAAVGRPEGRRCDPRPARAVRRPVGGRRDRRCVLRAGRRHGGTPGRASRATRRRGRSAATGALRVRGATPGGPGVAGRVPGATGHHPALERDDRPRDTRGAARTRESTCSTSSRPAADRPGPRPAGVQVRSWTIRHARRTRRGSWISKTKSTRPPPTPTPAEWTPSSQSATSCWQSWAVPSGCPVATESTGDRAERARKAVTMRIATAQKAIAEAHPELAQHLRLSVSTGRFCCYRPERPVTWRT